MFDEFLRLIEAQNSKESMKIGRSGGKKNKIRILLTDLKVRNHYLLNINTSVYKLLSVWLIIKNLQFLSANTLQICVQYFFKHELPLCYFHVYNYICLIIITDNNWVELLIQWHHMDISSFINSSCALNGSTISKW